MAACRFYCYSKVWMAGALAGHPEPLSDIPSRQAFRHTLPTYVSDIPLNHRSDIPSDIPFRRTLDNPDDVIWEIYYCENCTRWWYDMHNDVWWPAARALAQGPICTKASLNGGETKSPRVRHASDIPPTYPGPHCRPKA